MPERRPFRAIPLPAGIDSEWRIKLVVELAEQAKACMKERPAEATGTLEEAQRRLGQARGALRRAANVARKPRSQGL